MTNLDRLIAIGIALHGEHWQRAVSRDLGHSSPRQVQRWTTGKYSVPDQVIAELRAIARDRVNTINAAVADAD